jgi:hypothetical protein
MHPFIILSDQVVVIFSVNMVNVEYYFSIFHEHSSDTKMSESYLPKVLSLRLPFTCHSGLDSCKHDGEVTIGL